MYLSNAYAPRGSSPRWRRFGAATAAVAGLGLAAAGVGIATASSPSHPVPLVRSHGEVDVLSAGSLNTLMTTKVAAAFHRATGYTLVDTSGGSSTLAADIRNRIDVADVFVSASPAVTRSLMGTRNGNHIIWYATFAQSPYVLGYFPNSRYAKALRSEPWYRVVTANGFRLGRTNPAQDPGGKLAVTVLRDAAARYHLRALDTLASESADEYEETVEQAGIENGQLDASFMYEADANSQHSPFVALRGVPTQHGHYTISLVKGAPHRPAGLAFVKFLLGPEGRALLRSQRFAVISPAQVTGSYVPPSLKSLFGR